MEQLEEILPHVNASLNGLATILLVTGYVLIKRGNELAHKRTMLSCFGVSVLFLACYVLHKILKQGVNTPFPGYPPSAVRYTYYFILVSHILLAAAVPFLAGYTIYLGFYNRERHRPVAKVTFPIWLYVSITGVVVYLMIYHMYTPR